MSVIKEQLQSAFNCIACEEMITIVRIDENFRLAHLKDQKVKEHPVMKAIAEELTEILKEICKQNG